MAKKKQLLLDDEIPTTSRGVILQKALMSLIYGNMSRDSVEPVISPTALTEALCAGELNKFEIVSALNSYKLRIQNDSHELWYLLLLMLVTGCRVSEALALKHSDISPRGQIRLTGLKSSNDRLVADSQLYEYFMKCLRLKRDPFPTFNRFFVYRYLKKLGLYAQFESSSRVSVTHLFRHAMIEDLQVIDKGLELVQRNIGHKSIKSTVHYSTKHEK